MKNPLKIKVCGMLHPDNVEEVCALQPDFIGYIFYPGSKRYVGTKPDLAIFGIPHQEIGKVGVFVNEEISVVRQTFEMYNLNLVQLHGDESPQYCRDLDDSGIPVMKVLNPYAVSSGISLMEYIEGVRYFLFDTPGKDYGGTGQKFDWHKLEEYSIPLPFLISGGIGPKDFLPLRELDHPSLFGIDLNSKFETSPGFKDVTLLEDFFKEIKYSV